MEVANQQRANLAFDKAASQSSLSDWSSRGESRNAVNGRKNGHFSFHTAREFRPWWQVDLGAEYLLDAIVVYNRLDECSSRAYDIEILIGNDLRDFVVAHSQNGRPFGGIDGFPLSIELHGKEARFVRVQHRREEALHLDEVEVYGRKRL